MSPNYHYRAKDWGGKTVEGVYSAVNLREALDHLRARDLFVLDLKEQAATAGRSSRRGRPAGLLSRKKVKSRDLMVFCRQFHTMIQAGTTALQGLKVLAQQAEHPLLAEKLDAVAVSVERGSTLAEAFGRHPAVFPSILVNMVNAGEEGGVLDTVMDRLADHFEKQHDLEMKISSATTYPIVITALAFAVMALMVLFVLPQFAAIFEGLGMRLPWITRALLEVSHFVIKYWYLVLGLLAGLVVALAYYIKTERGRRAYDRARLKVPLFGPIYRKAVVARFARTLGTLIASGVDLINALELVERVIDNRIYAETLARTRDVIRQGQAIALPLAASGLFPPMLVEMVHVGEETGALDNMLSRTADFYEQEVTFFLDRLGTIIEPLLLIGIGIFVGLLLVSIVMPMFQIYEMI